MATDSQNEQNPQRHVPSWQVVISRVVCYEFPIKNSYHIMNVNNIHDVRVQARSEYYKLRGAFAEDTHPPKSHVIVPRSHGTYVEALSLHQ